MDDLIKRNGLVKYFEQKRDEFRKHGIETAGRIFRNRLYEIADTYNDAAAKVKLEPAFDAMKYRHWVIVDNSDGIYDYLTAITVTPDNLDSMRDEYPGYSEPRCFGCHGKALLNGAEEYVLSAFCPHCGAKMDLEVKKE